MLLYMKIILHNPSHNGDQLHTLGIVKQLINDNLDKHFIIIPACAMYLFNDLLSDKVIVEQHPRPWHTNKNIVNEINFISEIHDILWNYHCGNIYINMWKLLTQNNYNWISLVHREKFVYSMLKEIYNQTGINIIFNCSNYKELIPVLPYINIDLIREKIKRYNQKIIFFYNENSCSGFENEYPNNINEKVIQDLIDKYGDDYIILLSKPCNLFHKSLKNVESEFGIVPVIDAKNLILNANIANLCDQVYFKNNGGSFFILNKMNIENINNVKYFFIDAGNFYNSIKYDYGLNIELYTI